jgi:hypothetical protein
VTPFDKAIRAGLMSYFRPFRHSLLIAAAVLVADLGGRLAFAFQMSRVILLEAVVFGTAALLLVWAARRDREQPTAWRVDLWLAVIFGLGSLRAGLWSGGLPVGVANLAVLGVGMLAALGYRFRRWVVRRGRPA